MEFWELGRENFRQWGERFLQKFKESWRLRAAVFFTLAACTVMALFVLSDRADGQEHVALSAGSMERAGTERRAAALPIRGGSRALDRENLRNPFLAEHPAEGQQKSGHEAVRGQVDGRVRLTDGKGKAGDAQRKGRAAAGQVQAAASAGPVAGKAGDGADSKEKDSGLQLQGIIHAGDGMGALVLAGGKSRLLLAGEAWSGICLEGVEQDEAVLAVNGCAHRLRIGERLM